MTKIFIVNLKSSVSRRLTLEARLTELGIEGIFIEAVNGKEMPDDALSSHTRQLNYAFLRGEVGCALSHQSIYRRMLDENIEQALILEDDVHLPDNLARLLSDIVLSDTDPEVVLLSRVNKYLKRGARVLDEHFRLHKVHHATTAHAYIINKQAAANLLSALYPVWMVADKWSLFEDYSLLKTFAIIPAPVTLGSEAQSSTINLQKGSEDIDCRKQAIWRALMDARPLRVKIKHRLHRALVPLIYGVKDQGKGPR